MVTNDLGACEWFVWDLRRSSLIDRGQLDQIVSDFLRKNPRAEAPALAEYLVKNGTLTGFQAERILNGKTQGLVLGPYILLDSIGQGSMGQVFKASSKNDENYYAVKVLPRRSMWNVRLARRQVRSFGNFSHPAVTPFVDVGTAGGLHYLVWPLVDGETLENRVRNEGRLDAETVASIGYQVAQGLHACHANNIFHGLLKPSNIMLGNDQQCRLMDLGIGSLLVENEGESLVDTMSTANTLTSGLDCASPESIMDPTIRTPAGDQYSLGCTLYYALTGSYPFPEGNAVEKMMAHQSQQPKPIHEFNPDVPDQLVAIIDKLMAKKPEDRFSAMDEVAEALEPFVNDKSLVQASTGSMAKVGQSSRRAFNAGSKFNQSGLRGGIATADPIEQTPRPSVPMTNESRAIPDHRSSFSGNGFTGGSRGQFLSRDSFAEPEVSLTPARDVPQVPSHDDPAMMSKGWAANGYESDRKKPSFGVVGIVGTALVLSILVFLGAKFLLLD